MMAGVSQKSAESFCEKKKKIAPEKILESLEKINAKILFFEDENYPEKLKSIDSPPVILFCRGKILPEDDIALAVVGSRHISDQGKQMTEKLVPELCHAGLTIISGLARGVDAAAHRTALKTGGRTIGVLGNGIDDIYPSENRALAEKILASGGAIFSEFAPGVPPNAYHFPRRNRVVSGLSLGTLIVEGAEKSGSLITAQFALEQNREIFAIPGSPLAKMSAGPNRLIQKGEAKLILSAEDILTELPIEKIHLYQEAKKNIPNDPLEKSVFELLNTEAILFDEIVRKGDFPPAQLSATLTILEMKGFVIHLGGNRWARKE